MATTRNSSTTTDLAADSPMTYDELRELNARRALAPALAAMTPRERIGAAALVAEATGRDVSTVLARFHRLVEEAAPVEPAAGFAPVAVAELLDFIVDAVDTARQAAADSPRWLRAIDSAYDFILQQDVLSYDAAAHALRVESASEPGKVYESNGDCQCRAAELGNPCWHRAAARLVARAFELRALALGVVERQDVSLASARHYARAQFGHPGTLARTDAQGLAARITRARAALAA